MHAHGQAVTLLFWNGRAPHVLLRAQTKRSSCVHAWELITMRFYKDNVPTAGKDPSVAC
jgi:hypothetical protein